MARSRSTVTVHGPAGARERPATMNDLIRPLAAILLDYVRERTEAGAHVSSLLTSDVMNHDHTELARCDREGLTRAGWGISPTGSYFLRPGAERERQRVTARMVEETHRGAPTADRVRWYLLERGRAPREISADMLDAALTDHPDEDPGDYRATYGIGDDR